MADERNALDAVARILDDDDDGRYGEADELLDRARANGDLFFRIQRSRYALYRSLCLDLVEDDELGMSALRTLTDLKSERARPVLQHIADEPTSRARSDRAQRQRERVRVAQKGLQKLDRAAASSHPRPRQRRA